MDGITYDAAAVVHDSDEVSSDDEDNTEQGDDGTADGAAEIPVDGHAVMPRPPTTYVDLLLWPDMCKGLFEWIIASRFVASTGKATRGRKPWAAWHLDLKQRLFPPQMRAAVLRGESIYPYARLLMPGTRTVGKRKYLIKEKIIAECLIKAWTLAPDSADAVALRAYKSSSFVRDGRVSGLGATQDDFAAVVEKVAFSRLYTGSLVPWSIAKVNEWLDALAKAKDIIREDLFKEFVLLSPMEQKWLVRVIVADMKLSIDKNKAGHLPPHRVQSPHESTTVCTSCPALFRRFSLCTTLPRLFVMSRMPTCAQYSTPQTCAMSTRCRQRSLS